jgi:putative flippase GtrA
LTRYVATSAISTSVTLSLLGALVLTKTLTPGWANLVATAVGTVPSFELNRRWVWAKTGRRSLGREILPFCTLSFGGLALSTLVVSVAARWSSGAGISSAGTALVSQLANLSTFGALWVFQYLLLDRALFSSRKALAAGDQAAAAVVGDRPVVAEDAEAQASNVGAL